MSPDRHQPEMSPVAPRPGDEIKYEFPKEATVIIDDSFARKAEQRLDRIEKKLAYLKFATEAAVIAIKATAATIGFLVNKDSKSMRSVADAQDEMNAHTKKQEPEWPE